MTPISVDGLVALESAGNVGEAIGAVQAAIAGNEALSEVVVVNHQANAQSAGLELRPTQVILFGNPRLGTPLMQANQQVGLDLPQKVLAWEDASGQTHVGYNSPDYLKARHALEGVDMQLETISGALAMIAGNASAQPPATPDENASPGDEATTDAPDSPEAVTDPPLSVTANQGVITVTSNNSMDDTYNNLRQAIEDAPPLSLVRELDHAANAQSVDLELRPTRLIIFGNPNLGTPLMNASQTTAIDLPQKMLVYQDAAGGVFIAYNDPTYLAGRHGIEGETERLTTIAGALSGLANGAAGTAP